jgi:hypothetical protein
MEIGISTAWAFPSKGGLTQALELGEMQMNRIVAALGVVALLGFGLLSVSAHAGSLPPGKRIDFGTTTTGGTIGYPTGLNSSFSVMNAPITFAQQGPSDTLFAITGGTLDMTTGGCLKGCKFNSKTSGIQSYFADGGSISIYGSLPELPGDPTGLLFQGTFNSTLGSTLLGHKACPETNITLSSKGGVKSGGLNGCVQATFFNQTLLADLNFPPDNGGQGYFGELFFNLSYSPTTGWSGGIKNSDLNVIPTPEPSSLVLFGSALLVGAGLLRRKFRTA